MQANGFKPVKDIEPVSSDSVFAEVEAPAPSTIQLIIVIHV